MRLLKHHGKILKHHARTKHHSNRITGGSINHLQHGGNVSALKQQLRHMIIGKAKKSHRVRF